MINKKWEALLDKKVLIAFVIVIVLINIVARIEPEAKTSPPQKKNSTYETDREFWAKFPPEVEQAAFECSQLARVSQEYQKKEYGTPNTTHKEVYQTCMRNKGYGYVIDAR